MAPRNADFFTGATACVFLTAFFSLQFIRLFLAAVYTYIYCISSVSLLVGGYFWFYCSCSFQRSKGKRQFVPFLFASATKRTLLPVAVVQLSIPQKFRYPVVLSSCAFITEKTRECHLNHKVTRNATAITKHLHNRDFEAATAVILIGDHSWYRID